MIMMATTATYGYTTLVADFFMRGRMVGMHLLLQGVLLLARAGEGSGSRAGFWPVIVAAIVIMALCWSGLSVMSKGKETSLWQDENSEMNSSAIGHEIDDGPH